MAGLSARGQKTVLALNCGSSSLKFGLYSARSEEIALLSEGEAEEIGRPESSFWFKRASDSSEERENLQFRDHSAALAHALETLDRAVIPAIDAVGHRIVHGGPRLRQHQCVTPDVLEKLRAAVEYAPLHLPAALSVLEAVTQKRGDIRQVVCLDTAFHRTMPEVAKTVAFPEDVRRLGVERYGFHGLSVESVVTRLDPVPERLIVAHLGNGASLTAIRNGRSIDNTMGMTPSGGVMMGTRCGDLDPGTVIYLMRHGYSDASTLEELFDHRSGLVGVSGRTSDVRELTKIREQDARADLALRMFCYGVRKAIGGMAAALGGLDALVFTGGIGEHGVELREEIVSGLEFLPAHKTLILPAQEDLQIARITAKLLHESY